MTINGVDRDWVAMMPITLGDAAKRLLETIVTVEELGAQFQTDGYPSEDLERLTELGFLRSVEVEAHTARGRQHGTGQYVHETTELGKLWLTRCVDDDDDASHGLCAVFNSLDETTQWGFVKWAAMQIGMCLQPDKDEIADEDEGAEDLSPAEVSDSPLAAAAREVGQ